MSKTLFEKIWDKHVVDTLPDGTIQLYIDRLYCHEVTSPAGFSPDYRARGLKPFRPAQITCMPDHNIPDIETKISLSRTLYPRIKWIPWKRTRSISA